MAAAAPDALAVLVRIASDSGARRFVEPDVVRLLVSNVGHPGVLPLLRKLSAKRHAFATLDRFGILGALLDAALRGEVECTGFDFVFLCAMFASTVSDGEELDKFERALDRAWRTEGWRIGKEMIACFDTILRTHPSLGTAAAISVLLDYLTLEPTDRRATSLLHFIVTRSTRRGLTPLTTSGIQQCFAVLDARSGSDLSRAQVAASLALILTTKQGRASVAPTDVVRLFAADRLCGLRSFYMLSKDPQTARSMLPLLLEHASLRAEIVGALDTGLDAHVQLGRAILLLWLQVSSVRESFSEAQRAAILLHGWDRLDPRVYGGIDEMNETQLGMVQRMLDFLGAKTGGLQTAVSERRRVLCEERRRAKQLKDLGIDDISTPDDFLCPITKEPMRAPVVASDGHSYERDALMVHLQHSKRSPLTREVLDPKVCTPNLVLKKRIRNHFDEMCQAIGAYERNKRARIC